MDSHGPEPSDADPLSGATQARAPVPGPGGSLLDGGTLVMDESQRQRAMRDSQGPLVRTVSTGGLRYQLLRSHARGGLGEVFLAQDSELEREVAVKEMLPGHATDAQSRTRFVREARLTGRLEHPGVVPVHGIGTCDDGRPFYAMRFIHGETLDQAIRCGQGGSEAGGAGPALTLRQLLSRFVAICNTVAYAHSKGVVHRDLKPSNILLGPFGETLVVDWGLAKAATVEGPEDRPRLSDPTAGDSVGSDTETRDGVVLGTPAYMAPEQAAGRWDEVGPAADVYSLGAVLYAVLTGKAPFGKTTLAETLSRVKTGDFPPPRQARGEVPAALEAVCCKAMALKPADRYPTALDLAADVEHWLADEPVGCYREPFSVRAARWLRRHRSLATSAAALLLTATVALAVGLVAVNAERERTHTAELAALARGREAEEQRNAAEAARTLEGKERRRTRQALDAMSSQVIEGWLSRQQLSPEEKDFLKQSLEYYEEFARDTGAEPEQVWGVGKAQMRVGRIRAMLAQYPEAEAAERRAVELLSRLAVDHPAIPEYGSDLAAAYNHLAVVLAATGRGGLAEAEYREAITVLGRLVAAHPESVDFRGDGGRNFNNLAALLRAGGRPGEAEAAGREGVAIFRRLVAEQPGRPDCRSGLAAGLNNLGNLLRADGRAEEAEAGLREALALRQALADEHPLVADYRNDLAGSLVNLALLLRDRQDLAGARRLLEQAGPHHRAAVTAVPRNPTFRQFYRENLDVLSQTLLGLGDHDAAARAAAVLAANALTAEDAYNAGCYLATCVGLVGKDPKVAQTRRPELAKQYADRAMAHLRQAVEKGYRDLAHLQGDSDLAPLRQRDDFKALTAALGAGPWW
jgi:serine/threonine-protein kinase